MRFVIFAFIAAAVAAAAASATQQALRAGAEQAAPPGTDRPQDEQVVGPGRVHITLTRDGRWLDFTPAWNGESALFTRGGLFILAKGPDGNLTEILNSAAGHIRVGDSSSRIRACQEGMDGGFRAPSVEPDDDRDGRVDEDRLDGADNDGDGRVDEDFAAIGDEMTATCYFAPAIEGSLAHVAVHQESYAWSLPHVDGAVMLSLWVRNIGSDPLEGVRIGALFEKDGPFYFSDWLVSLSSDDVKSVSRASALVCEDMQGTTTGLVVFPGNGANGAVWSGGVVESAETDFFAIAARVGAGDAAAAGETKGENGVGAGASVLKSRETRVDGRAVVYHASPDLGTLEPGREIRVDLALFAVRERNEVEAAAINAFKTFTGDRSVRYLPPPVAMTPRVVWGSYRPIESGPDEPRRLAVEFDALGTDALSPEDVSYLSGVDPDDMAVEEIEPGVHRIVLRGETAESALRKGERMVLKGRLENGDFFEAVLRPAQGALASAAGPEAAALFWKTEGRLDFELLASSPNPFRDVTTITYEIPSLLEQPDGTRIETRESMEISVKVYNVVGRLVSVLVDEISAPGTYTTQWRAADDQGNAVASGVYYVRLQIGKKFLTQRLILLK